MAVWCKHLVTSAYHTQLWKGSVQASKDFKTKAAEQFGRHSVVSVPKIADHGLILTNWQKELQRQMFECRQEKISTLSCWFYDVFTDTLLECLVTVNVEWLHYSDLETKQ